MELKGKTVLILGGSGLVGMAVARRLLANGPARIVLVGLYESEVREAAEELRGWAGETEILDDWGNVFLPTELAKYRRADILDDEQLRALVIRDLLDSFTPEVLERSFLYQLLEGYRPEAVVDCINTATAFAYQDVFTSARHLLSLAQEGDVSREEVEKHVLTLTIPQLIRHVQIAVEAMRLTQTRVYVKIGTSGTGGMGLNIPYTHSEERPSRTLLTKAAVAGAHSILLFLVARTPGAPAAIEIKPTAAIAWRKIAYGPVMRGGQPIDRYDCPEPMAVSDAFSEKAAGWVDLHEPVESVFIDVGENGVFARDEFETVTSLGQMEFITPEEVADAVVMELEGRTTGKDIVAALDSATSGPTYTAGVLRHVALRRLDELEANHDVRSVAFEMLGPPRLSKMLYESYIWSIVRPSVSALAESEPDRLASDAAELVATRAAVRSTVISIGFPIILGGNRVYRGGHVILPPDGSELDRLVSRGWVDLRPSNCRLWIDRARRMIEQATARRRLDGESGSYVDWYAIEPGDSIAPAQFAKWVFRYEDGGERIKR